jgi:hypothetical protein
MEPNVSATSASSSADAIVWFSTVAIILIPFDRRDDPPFGQICLGHVTHNITALADVRFVARCGIKPDGRVPRAIWIGMLWMSSLPEVAH